MALPVAMSRGLGRVRSELAGPAMVVRPVGARRVAGVVARHTSAKRAIGATVFVVRRAHRGRGRGSVSPLASVGPASVDALTNLVPQLDALGTLATAHIATLADAAVVAMDAQSFADAADAFASGAPVSVSDSVDAFTSATSNAMDAAQDAVAASEEPAGIKRMEGILSPISDRLESFVLGTQALFTNVGVPYPLGSSIIFTTFVVKALTFPFTKSQVESTMNVQNLAPQTDAIRAKYKDDPERMNVEINRLYEENQVSPLAGCVPILLTLPVVWGLYRAFNNASIDGSFDEPWLFIPSLAGPSPDRTLDWLLPLDANYDPPIGWHDASLYLIVPLLTVASQYVSMNLLTPPKDPNADPDAPEPNQSVLLQALPLFIGYVSLTVPAGLTLYWLFNNVFTTATQVYLRQGGGAVAKIEKTADFTIKVPLGCAVVDLATAQTQPRGTAYDGPYVIYGDETDATQDSDNATDMLGGGGGGGEETAAVLETAASGGGAFYTTDEERSALTEKWRVLLANRSSRARNPADRAMASVGELRAVITELEQSGAVDEAREVEEALQKLEEAGGDAYRKKLTAQGEETRAADEARAMREAVGADEESSEENNMGGLPSMEELENAVITPEK